MLSAPSRRAGRGRGAAHLRRHWIGAKQAPRYQLTTLKVEGQTRAHTLLRHKWGYAVVRQILQHGVVKWTAGNPQPLWLSGASIPQYDVVSDDLPHYGPFLMMFFNVRNTQGHGNIGDIRKNGAYTHWKHVQPWKYAARHARTGIFVRKYGRLFDFPRDHIVARETIATICWTATASGTVPPIVRLIVTVEAIAITVVPVSKV